MWKLTLVMCRASEAGRLLGRSLGASPLPPPLPPPLPLGHTVGSALPCEGSVFTFSDSSAPLLPGCLCARLPATFGEQVSCRTLTASPPSGCRRAWLEGEKDAEARLPGDEAGGWQGNEGGGGRASF